MKNIITASLLFLLSVSAFAQTKTVTKSPATNELTEQLKIGAQTFTVSSAGTFTFENGATVNGGNFLATAIGALNSGDIGSTVQAWDAQLNDLSGIAPNDGIFIVGDGANFVAEGGSTARDSLGLGASDSVTFASVDSNGTVSFAGPGAGKSYLFSDASVDRNITAPDKAGYLPIVADSGGLVDVSDEITGTLSVANGGTGITSLGTGVATWLGTPSSANLAAAVTGETGSGALVFGTSPTLSNVTISGATANTIASFNGSNVLTSLSTATYPTLTELSYVKGVTSAIQTQLNAKIGGTVGSSGAVAVSNGTSLTPSSVTVTGGGLDILNIPYGVVNNSLAIGFTLLTSNNIESRSPSNDLGWRMFATGQGEALLGSSNSLTNPASFKVIGTYTSSSNFEALTFIAGASENQVKPTAGGGGGTARPTSYHTTDTGVRLMSGAGTPEGAVTAPVGSLYTRTDGGASTTLYVKESGTGNTGWVAK